MIVQYICAECGRHFSFIEAIHEPRDRRREAVCPWCSCRTLVLVGREFEPRKKRKISDVTERFFMDQEDSS